MKITNQKLYNQAHRILTRIYGPDATFREGQYEAIEAAMTKHRTLVVQKTGWGKSLVYFISTAINRSQGHGTTLVISPLLVLMDNQMDFAQDMGLKCAALNSTVKKGSNERFSIIQQWKDDQLDVLFITPETLLSEEIQTMMPQIKVGLLVIDEAHCISDWGHDFRLDYGQLGRIISGLPSNIPVLATTATANDRVVRDLEKQLGKNVFISRGPLTRESLHIQVLHFETKTDRYAWLLENLPRLPGTGIVYCITRNDCEQLAMFLNQNNISSRPYYAGDGNADANEEAIESFQHNRIKAIVSTTKLGMGYDKGDISFVIHYQSPASIVAWYQQIGRAGRKLSDAYTFLMTGREDDDINNYFIETAFPSLAESTETMKVIENGKGLTIAQIESQVNLRKTRISNTLRFLENEQFIRKEYDGSRYRYYSTAHRFSYNKEHYQAIMAIRRKELQQMHDLIRTKDCLSRFAVNALDDHTAKDCGKCANCTGNDIYPNLSVSQRSRDIATAYLNATMFPIEPRKTWPDGKRIKFLLKPGICIAKYGDPGYGELVKIGKYPPPGSAKCFDDRLVLKSADVLLPLVKEHNIRHITFVPSLRSKLVRDFAIRLAKKTGLDFVELLVKSEAPQQKEMENSSHQWKNASDSFSIKTDACMPPKVILVDDIVDSKWTLTVCGSKIMEHGCREVYPFVLADSSHREN